jgi:hypothetical protein
MVMVLFNLYHVIFCVCINTNNFKWSGGLTEAIANKTAYLIIWILFAIHSFYKGLWLMLFLNLLNANFACLLDP